MTIWLQKRLAIWMGASLCGGALLWNVGASRAQNYSDAEVMKLVESRRNRGEMPKLTRVEAAKIFADFMDAIPLRVSDNPYTTGMRMLISISPKTERQLGDKQGALISKMLSQWKQNKPKIKSSEVTGGIGTKSTNRALVLREENGGWGVDLVETYAKWNNLQGVPKLQAIYQLTGVMLEGLPHTDELKRSSCQTNLKRIALGIAQYAQDYDGKLPPAKSWGDELQPYVRNEEIFNCPALPKRSLYGYAYNSKLSGVLNGAVAKREQTVSIYETSILKRNAYGTSENRAFRHQNGANYAFADGHVKWFPKTQTPSFKLKP